MASLVCSALVLLATFFLLPWLYYLPKCVLASMYVFRQPYAWQFIFTLFPSICLVVFSLLAEAPHDVKFYWRSVFVPLDIWLSVEYLLRIVGCEHG